MTKAEKKQIERDIKKLQTELIDYIPELKLIIDNPALAFETASVSDIPSERLEQAVSKLARLVKLELFLGVYGRVKKQRKPH